MSRYEPLADNLILDTDSYKASHWLQYPPGTQGLFAYLESRGGRYPATLFFGLQYILKRYLSQRVTPVMVAEAAAFWQAHGEPFNKDGWDYIATTLEGRLPLRIRAVPEGSLVPVRNALMTVESTDPKVFWLVTWLETQLLRVWYPTTVATQSWYLRGLIFDYLSKTAADPAAEIGFKLHDFGARGVSSPESAGIGGMAHLVSFLGTDTVQGVRYANYYYDHPMAGFSIPAAEHSTITAWGRDRELDAYRNMLTQFAKPGSLVAVVSDSYDIWQAIEHLWGGELRQAVIDSGATVVIRPDSGNPPVVVSRVLQLLEACFGTTTNSKGYKVLNHVRVIQGDGINPDSLVTILDTITRLGFSASNVAFGIGGALLQQVNRDTQRFAYKCSEVTIEGQQFAIAKDPATDASKRSKAGRLDLIRINGEYSTATVSEGTTAPNSALDLVYENGELMREDSFDTIRQRALG